MILKKILFILIILCVNFLGFSQKNHTLSGYVTNANSGEALIGVIVKSQTLGIGTATNAYGFFSLTVQSDSGTILYSFLGYQTQAVKYTSKDFSQPLNIKLEELSNEIKEIVIYGNTEVKDALKTTNGSVSKVPMNQIKLVPSIMGESDIIKTLQLMPGVVPGSEIGTNFFVRGGEADQNLVILDEAVIYNSGHLLGFFSVFNSDVIKDVQLYKGGFPANYGGRLSSVLEVRTKDGNMNQFHSIGNIGLLSSKLTLEGPIIKEKLSFIISGRRTYVDKVYGAMGVPIPYYFYDLNTKINLKIGPKDRIFLSAYIGNDILYTPDGFFEEDTTSVDTVNTDSTSFTIPKVGFNLGNKTITLRWNHQFNSKIFNNTSLIYNNFKYDLNAEDGINALLISSSLEDYSFKTDFYYNLNNSNQILFGALVTNHIFEPNLVFSKGDVSDLINNQESLNLKSWEICGYILDEILLFKRIKINAGLRYAYVLSEDTTYKGLEPRLFVNWMINDKNSFKFGYSIMNQYLHRVSSSNFIMPTDMYYPVTKNVKPQSSSQIFISYSKHFKKNNLILTIEAYNKDMSNLIEFREGTKLFLNNNFEKDLLTGTGNSKGIEVYLQKTEGIMTGWISYTYSISNRTFEGLNNGLVYFAKNDRRHNFSIVTIFKFTEKIDLSASWVFLSGAKFTPIIGQYIMPNPAQNSYEIIPIFAPRNSVQMSDIHRLDVSITYKPHIGKNRKFKTEWVFGVYNLYNRAAPYRIEIVYDERGFYKYQEPGLFGRIFNVSFNFFF